ncbi:MAG TPA: hypothetical protein VH854_14190 [Thermoanaerobaculia bacterium]|nr:hypothetical protein [Thermoanaerobaculia bacterium]
MRRLLALALLVPALLAVGEGLHHHETLAALLSAGPAAANAPRAISSHNPLSHGSHWHAVVLVHEDSCAACSAQRAFGLPTSAAVDAPLSVSRTARAYTASVRLSFTRLALRSRAPPSLL